MKLKRAVIVSYDCADIDPIEKWIPEDKYDVDFWMNFTIGLDQNGGDNFQVRVVTPSNLRGEESGQYAIILNSYSWTAVISSIEVMLEQCQDIGWSGISNQLSKLMYWEYQDYQP